jgi:hypothetical protein
MTYCRIWSKRYLVILSPTALCGHRKGQYNQVPIQRHPLKLVKMKLPLLVIFSLFCLSFSVSAQSEKASVAPKTAQTTAKHEETPWLDIGVEHRTRYETLDNRFRLGEVGSDQQLPQSTRLRIEIKKVIAPFGLVMEFQDSRIHLDDSGSTVTNTMVDENDITQLYLSFAKPLGKAKLSSTIYVGRQSFDLGSRRLVSRPRFRNTTNSFDAIRWTLGSDKHWQLTTFLSRPVVRRMHQPDKPSDVTGFWGAFLAAKFTSQFKNEFYYYGLRESMTSPKCAQRQYSTMGTRLYKDQKPGQMSYEVETALQFGKKVTLHHLAHLEHVSVDYTLNTKWRPMLTGRYDYASGTKDPTSQDEGTFDSLYGDSRWEYGPTGIYGAFARSNISSPGWALELNPSKKLMFSSAMRWVWLASARDLWVGSKLKDPTGNSGSYIGSHVELRLRYSLNKYFRPEIGYVRFLKGSYLARVPKSPGSEDSNYLYVEASFTFDHLLSLR